MHVFRTLRDLAVLRAVRFVGLAGEGCTKLFDPLVPHVHTFAHTPRPHNSDFVIVSDFTRFSDNHISCR